MYFRTEGVILSHRNFGEADRILTIYTQDFGKVKVLAKGVRRPRSKKAGHVELANWCKVFIARGKNIDLLTEVELKKSFGISDFSLAKANKIYNLLELVEVLTPTGQKNREVFKLLTSFLAKIESEDNFALLSSAFKVKLLSILGFFSAKIFQDYQVKKMFEILVEEDFGDIKTKVKLGQKAYLKLCAFLDSMIENLAESKLKTVRFLNGTG